MAEHDHTEAADRLESAKQHIRTAIAELEKAVEKAPCLKGQGNRYVIAGLQHWLDSTIAQPGSFAALDRIMDDCEET